MKVYEHLLERIKQRGSVHFTLVDPAFDHEHNIEMIKKAEEFGTDAILVGGSFNTTNIGEMVKKVKGATKLPVIISPGNIHDIAGEADAIFYYSMMNSRNPYYITQVQVLSSIPIKSCGLEPISVGYIVFEPGMTAGFVGDANLIRRDKPEIALAFALSSQFLGHKMVYFEAGSGSPEHVPLAAIKLAKKNIKIPLIVGGGIRDGETAKKIVEAGADCIVTGTIVEDKSAGPEKLKSIISAIKKK